MSAGGQKSKNNEVSVRTWWITKLPHKTCMTPNRRSNKKERPHVGALFENSMIVSDVLSDPCT